MKSECHETGRRVEPSRQPSIFNTTERHRKHGLKFKTLGFENTEIDSLVPVERDGILILWQNSITQNFWVLFPIGLPQA